MCLRNKVLKTRGYVRNFTYLGAANITSKQKTDMAKVAIKNENITSFGGIYHIMDVFSKLGFEKLTESVLGKRGSSGKAFCYGSIFCGFSYFPIGLGGGFHDYARTKNPRKSPYQWINPKNVTSIYKSTSQGIMLRN